MIVTSIFKLLITFAKMPAESYMLWHEGAIHFRFILDNFNPVVILETYEDFNRRKDLELAILRNETDPEDYIAKAFKAAKGCRFIIFQAGPNEFIQFWIQHGGCLLSYPLARGNNHRVHLEQVLKMIQEFNFKRVPYRKGYGPQIGYYMFCPHGRVTDYSVNFGMVSPEAVNFAKRMFVEVFEEDLMDVRASVG